MSGIGEARTAMAEFRRLWFDTPGTPRDAAASAALHADDVIEALDDYAAHYDEVEAWIGDLERVPEVEKRWHGLREYRESHRVR